jgi:hypothetical protein
MPGRKQYSPPRVVMNRGSPFTRRRNGLRGMVKGAGAVVGPDQRVLLGTEPDEVAVVDPDPLEELELAGDAGPDDQEGCAAVHPSSPMASGSWGP